MRPKLRETDSTDRRNSSEAILTLIVIGRNYLVDGLDSFFEKETLKLSDLLSVSYHRKGSDASSQA